MTPVPALRSRLERQAAALTGLDAGAALLDAGAVLLPGELDSAAAVRLMDVEALALMSQDAVEPLVAG